MKPKPKCKLCQATESLTTIELIGPSRLARYLKVCKPCKDYVLAESNTLDEIIDKYLEED